MQKFSSQDIEKLKQILGVKDRAGETEKKLWKKVHFHKRFFKIIPGIEAICVCNSLAMNACHENSDIDLFIITQSGRLWSARLYITIYCYALGLRKNANKHKGRFCLSFYCSMNEQSIFDIAIDDDIYLHNWIQSLKPVVNKNHAFEQFCIHNKLWIREETRRAHNGYTQKKGTKIGDYIESVIQKIYKPRTLREKQKLGNPFGIIVSDTMLKFHNQDRRKILRDQVFKK